MNFSSQFCLFFADHAASLSLLHVSPKALYIENKNARNHRGLFFINREILALSEESHGIEPSLCSLETRQMKQRYMKPCSSASDFMPTTWQSVDAPDMLGGWDRYGILPENDLYLSFSLHR